MKSTYIKQIILILIVGMVGCKKDFLDAKPDKSLLIPSTIADFQNLLDNYNIMNQAPYLSQISSDDIYTTTAGYNGASVIIRNSYIWASDVYQGQATITDWNTPYQCVYYANIVLDGLSNLKPGMATITETNRIKGQALFYRAMAFYQLAQEFAPAFSDNTADQQLGIPIRLSSDVQVKSVRSTLRQTYEQIVSDLTTAKSLLPQTDAFKTRPIRSAGMGLLARVCLTMGNYEEGRIYADSCISLNRKLLDYNQLNVNATRPFPVSLTTANDEVLYYHTLTNVSFLSSPSLTIIDSTLYNSYATNDLRKTAYFNNKGKGIVLFKGNYTGSGGVFAGIATDEVYLIRAECYARMGDIGNAMKDLNALMITRYRTNTYVPLTAGSVTDAVHKILDERRKELVYRNLRWSDLKRLNSDPNYAVQLSRTINGITYTLSPKDNKYAFPIPDNEIFSAGLIQNPR